MTRWCTRILVLIGSTMTLGYVAAAGAWARPVDEHVGSTAVVEGGLPSLPEQPVDVVPSGAPVTGWLVAVLVVVLMAGVVLVVRSSRQHHMHAA